MFKVLKHCCARDWQPIGKAHLVRPRQQLTGGLLPENIISWRRLNQEGWVWLASAAKIKDIVSILIISDWESESRLLKLVILPVLSHGQNVVLRYQWLLMQVSLKVANIELMLFSHRCWLVFHVSGQVFWFNHYLTLLSWADCTNISQGWSWFLIQRFNLTIESTSKIMCRTDWDLGIINFVYEKWRQF